MPALRDPNRKGVAGSLTNAVGGRRHIARAVDGTSHVDRVSSSLGFAAFLADCLSFLSSSLELIR